MFKDILNNVKKAKNLVHKKKKIDATSELVSNEGLLLNIMSYLDYPTNRKMSLGSNKFSILANIPEVKERSITPQLVLTALNHSRKTTAKAVAVFRQYQYESLEAKIINDLDNCSDEEILCFAITTKKSHDAINNEKFAEKLNTALSAVNNIGEEKIELVEDIVLELMKDIVIVKDTSDKNIFSNNERAELSYQLYLTLSSVNNMGKKLLLQQSIEQDAYVNIIGVNLSGIELQNFDLAYSSFCESTLDYAKFNRANLQGADLSNIIGAGDFTEAILVDANLTNADCAQAIFTSAQLINAILINARLENAILDSANLTGADLSGADLTDANLTKSNLTDAKLNQTTNMTNADLSEANLQGLNLSYICQKGVKFKNNNFFKDSLDDFESTMKRLRSNFFVLQYKKPSTEQIINLFNGIAADIQRKTAEMSPIKAMNCLETALKSKLFTSYEKNGIINEAAQGAKTLLKGTLQEMIENSEGFQLI